MGVDVELDKLARDARPLGSAIRLLREAERYSDGITLTRAEAMAFREVLTDALAARGEGTPEKIAIDVGGQRVILEKRGGMLHVETPVAPEPAAEPDHGYIGFAPFYISEQQFLATWGNDWSGNPVKIIITPTRQASSDIELLVSRGERAPAVPDLEKLANSWDVDSLDPELLPVPPSKQEIRHIKATQQARRQCARELRKALKMENHNV